MLTQEETWLLNEKYQGHKTDGFVADCQRLKSGEPLAYIIGHINFLNCQIWLDSRPLIPRTETEFGVELLIQELKKRDLTYPLRVLDLCAGSGCIGIAITKAVPSAMVDFIELDPSHIPTIEKNCQINNLTPEQIRVMAGNLFTNLATTNRYDFIISNPPYIDPQLNRAEPSVKSFEPHLALYGGAGGLELINEIIKTAPEYLQEEGELWIEHEPEQTEEIRSLGSQAFIVTVLKDQYQVDRFSRLVLR